jgi:hypothetical protein
MRYIDIVQGELVDTNSRSRFEGTRRKAARYDATGSTIRATSRRADDRGDQIERARGGV